jgi:hypothetical protein
LGFGLDGGMVLSKLVDQTASQKIKVGGSDKEICSNSFNGG